MKKQARSSTLRSLYRRVDRCPLCRAANNDLQHIHGFGAMRPDLMLVFVNPTHRNTSADPSYRGPRFPFIGVRQLWRVLADAGLIDRKKAAALPPRKEWTAADTATIQQELVKHKLFITNVVKCCYDHSAYPERDAVRHHLDLLGEEIRIVRPKTIVAFSGFVYQTLTGQSVKMGEYWKDGQKALPEIISGLRIPTLPCYFPVGRGSPRKAASILRRIERKK
ncbi:MAG: hypothetical protein KGI60_02850 [Patescibacteria group bacterium]|nr:hypothetical protein [Patescibacteria group bacterium]